MRTEPAALAFLTALKLWIAAVRPVEGISWTIYDDRWFLQRAESILASEWLGELNYLTLIKGPIYPLWIAFTASLGLPLLFAQQVLYALACLAMVRALTPLLTSAWMRVTLFAVVLFNPMTLADVMSTRVLREGLYPSLALLVAAGTIGTVLHGKKRWAVLNGIALAAFWHTREEGIWMAPLLVVAACIVIARRQHVVGAIGIPLLMFAITHASLRIVNGVRYGIWEIVEFQDEHFLRAYASLTHVKQRAPRARVPVPKEVRERVYAVSPTFASLRPRLEGKIGADWNEPDTLGDMGGAGFMWAFRQSAGEMGWYDRGGAGVHAFYDRITSEIAAARESGRLEANEPKASMLPPMLPGQYKEIALRWLEGMHRVVKFSDMTFGPPYSLGPMHELREYKLTHTRLAPVEGFTETLHLAGWIVHVDGTLDVSIEGAPEAVVKRLPSPGLYEHLKNRWKDFPPAKHAGYDIRAPLGATMVLKLNGREIERLPLTQQPPISYNKDVRMSVDQFEVIATRNLPKPKPTETLRITLMRQLAKIYQHATVPLFVLSVPFVLFVLKKPPIIPLVLLTTVAARTLILATIDVTSFWVFTPMYEAPSHPLMLTALVLMFRTR